MYKQPFKPPPSDTDSDISTATAVSQGIPAPFVQVSARGDFGRARRTKENASLIRSFSKTSSRSQLSALDSASLVFGKNSSDSANKENVNNQEKSCSNSTYGDDHEASMYGVGKPPNQFGRPTIFHLGDNNSRSATPQPPLNADQVYLVSSLVGIAVHN